MLWLSGTKVSDFSALQKLENLQDLTLADSTFSDLRLLSAMHRLESLQLDATGIVDLRPLEPLINLKQLWLASTRVSSIAPLAALKKLESLDISHTSVQDLRPLDSIPLKRVTISKGAIPAAAIQAFRVSHPRCFLTEEP